MHYAVTRMSLFGYRFHRRSDSGFLLFNPHAYFLLAFSSNLGPAFGFAI